MKKNHFSLKKYFTLLAIAVGYFMLPSCLNHDNYYYVNPPAAGILLINATPSSPDLNLIGDNRIEYLPSRFAYDSAIGYLPAYPGNRMFGFATQKSDAVLASLQTFLKPHLFYSIFIADTLSAAKMFIFNDSLKTNDSTKAGVRFINMSADSKGLSLVLGTNTWFSNVTFGNATDFMAVDTTSNATIQIKENGSNAVLATLSNIPLKKGRFYTIYTRGFEHTSVDSLKIGLKQIYNGRDYSSGNNNW